MSRRFFLCLAASCCCCCLALLVLPVQGRIGGAAVPGGGLGGRDLLLSDPGFHHVAEPKGQQRGVRMKARPSWLPTPAAGRVRSELRSVPGGPDPMHHHGSPRWPEQEERTTP